MPPEQPDAGSTCLSLFPVQPSSSAEVNGALCYGIAISSSSALECAPSAVADVTECSDALLGTAYTARWAGSSGTVQATFTGTQIGSIVQVDANTFTLVTATSIEGVCTVVAGSPGRADFCLHTAGP